jgi:aminoglycoside 2''-phosphotransferase
MDIVSAHVDRIRASFPTLALDSVSYNLDGLTNTVVIVNDELVFRFPKDEVSRAALVREAMVLELARQFVSTPIPYFEWQADDFVMYRLIRGEPLYRQGILRQDERGQEQYAEQLALFLRQLHAVPRDDVVRALGEAVERQPGYWLERYQDVQRHIYPLLWADQRHWIDDLFAPVLDGSLNMVHNTPVLIHDDLASYHILHSPDERRITGVIDFGMARLGDPAADFALIISTYGESFLKRMSRYDPAIDATLDRARFLSGALELSWAVEGVRTNELSWLLVHIGRARDALPLGASW